MDRLACLDSYSTNIDAAGAFENQMLYRMCREGPDHTNGFPSMGLDRARGSNGNIRITARSA